METKAGWQTTEFWMMLLGNLIALAVLFGFVDKGDEQSVKDSISLAIQNAFALLTSLGTIWKYIQSRTEVKAFRVDAQARIAMHQIREGMMPRDGSGAKSASRFALVLVLGLLIPSGAFAADYNFILKDGKYYLVNKDDPSQPNKPVSVQVINLGGTGGNPTDPTDPPPPPTTDFSKQIAKFTTEAIQAGGTPTTAAAISSVYSLASASVADGSLTVDSCLAFTNMGVNTVMTRQADREKWDTFRKSVSGVITKLRQEGTLPAFDQPEAKAAYVGILKEIADGMNSVTGFNGSVTNPQQSFKAGEGILDNIDIERLMQLIKFIMEIWNLFKGTGLIPILTVYV